MNVIVGTAQRGFVENEWLGRKLAIGDQVRIDVALPDPRCVMPSLAQEELEGPRGSSRRSPSTTGSPSRVRSTPAPAYTPSSKERGRFAWMTASGWS